MKPVRLRTLTQRVRCAHEESYRGFHLAAHIHRARLRAIKRVLVELPLPDNGVLGDFGCSNGFILEQLRRELFPPASWEFLGFDWNEELLRLARLRDIPRTTFHRVDLNEPSDDWAGRFDVVTLFETIEHVGRIETAMRNVVTSCRRGGLLLVSAPNESGLPGILKYFGRRLVRRNPDGDFFEGRSRWSYLCQVVRGGDLSAFREPERPGWSSHLGFDLRRFHELIMKELVAKGSFGVLRVAKTALGFGRLYVLEKTS